MKYSAAPVVLTRPGKVYLSLASNHHTVGKFEIDPTRQVKICFGSRTSKEHMEFEITGNARKDKPPVYFLKLSGKEMAFQPLIDVNDGGETILVGREHGNLAYDIQRHIPDTAPRYMFAVTLEDGIVKVESLSIKKGIHVYLENEYDNATMRALLRQNSLSLQGLFPMEKWKKDIDYTEIPVPDVPGLKIDMMMRSGIFSIDGTFLAYIAEHEHDIDLSKSLVISFLRPVENGESNFSVQLDYNEEINGPIPGTLKFLINQSFNNARIMFGYNY